MSQWVSLYREQGEAGLAVQPQGRPEGSGRALSSEQEQESRQLVVESVPCDHDIAIAMWTRQAVSELIASVTKIDQVYLIEIEGFIDTLRKSSRPMHPVQKGFR